jgi:hypothetical protein
MAARSRSRLLAGLLLLAVVSSAIPRLTRARAEPPPPPQAVVLQPGIDPAQARALLGPPLRTARQIFSHRTREQWVYGPPRNLRLVFDCPQGEKPRLLWFAPTRP